MALTPFTGNDTNVSALPDKPLITPAALKKTFDQFGIDFKTYFNATSLPEIEAAIASGTANPQLIYNLYNFDTLCQTLKGYYKVTAFDTPTAGNITETIKKTSDDSVLGTKVTLFNTPSPGNIRETLAITSLGISVAKTTVFDSPVVGQITETYA